MSSLEINPAANTPHPSLFQRVHTGSVQVLSACSSGVIRAASKIAEWMKTAILFTFHCITYPYHLLRGSKTETPAGDTAPQISGALITPATDSVSDTPVMPVSSQPQPSLISIKAEDIAKQLVLIPDDLESAMQFPSVVEKSDLPGDNATTDELTTTEEKPLSPRHGLKKQPSVQELALEKKASFELRTNLVAYPINAPLSNLARMLEEQTTSTQEEIKTAFNALSSEDQDALLAIVAKKRSEKSQKTLTEVNEMSENTTWDSEAVETFFANPQLTSEYLVPAVRELVAQRAEETKEQKRQSLPPLAPPRSSTPAERVAQEAPSENLFDTILTAIEDFAARIRPLLESAPEKESKIKQGAKKLAKRLSGQYKDKIESKDPRKVTTAFFEARKELKEFVIQWLGKSDQRPSLEALQKDPYTHQDPLFRALEDAKDHCLCQKLLEAMQQSRQEAFERLSLPRKEALGEDFLTVSEEEALQRVAKVVAEIGYTPASTETTILATEAVVPVQDTVTPTDEPAPEQGPEQPSKDKEESIA